MAQPNIIFIHVDEMRFPMHLPANAPTPDAFLAKYMPNLYSLWTKGVKFKRYFTAAADCTPGRGTFVTGLYAYQTGLFLTRESTSNPYATKQPQPALHPDFPTYGKVLREARPGFTPYETPYIGKWHLSNSPEGPNDTGAATYLEEYGFKGLTMPDPLGMPSQVHTGSRARAERYTTSVTTYRSSFMTLGHIRSHKTSGPCGNNL